MPPTSRLIGFLKRMLEIGASDLHLSSQCYPLARLHGNLVQVDEVFLVADDVARLVEGLLEPHEWSSLPQRKNIDFAYEAAFEGKRRRFRCNTYSHGLGLSVVFRAIPSEIPSIDDCGLPETVKAFTRHHQGLVMVTGPAGCGKTTTLAALIGYINDRKRVHIISVEDPIEFVHESRKALIHQRQLGMDVDTYQNALRGALREDPDVILIGGVAGSRDHPAGHHRRRDRASRLVDHAHHQRSQDGGPPDRPVPHRPAAPDPHDAE